MSLKRLYQELHELRRNSGSTNGFTASPVDEEEMYRWQGSILGPQGSPYEDGVYFLLFHFSDIYPYKPPKVEMTTSCYHPNINKNGVIKLDILKSKWHPDLTISKILQRIIQFLADPDPDYTHEEPLNPEIALEFKEDREKFNEKAREWTRKYAI